jgi:hypothetical protein
MHVAYFALHPSPGLLLADANQARDQADEEQQQHDGHGIHHKLNACCVHFTHACAVLLADANQARDQVDEEQQQHDEDHGMEATLAPPASLAADADHDAAAVDAADAAADAAEAEPSADETCGSADELGEEADGDMQQQQVLEEGGEECSPLASCGQAYETVRDYCLARTQVGRAAVVETGLKGFVALQQLQAPAAYWRSVSLAAGAFISCMTLDCVAQGSCGSWVLLPLTASAVASTTDS